jgi:integrase/recombinase XerD
MITNEQVEAHLLWLEKTRGRLPDTLVAYGSSLRKFVAWLDGQEPTEGLVEQFTQRPRPKAPIPAASTVNRDLYAIRSLMGWLVRKGEVPSNVAEDVLTSRVTNSTPRAVKDDVWMVLWCSDLTDDQRVWLGLAYYVGLRRHEIAQVGPGHFDVERELIVNFKRKGGSRYSVEYGGMAGVVCDRLPHLSLHVDHWRDLLAKAVWSRREDQWLAPLSIPTDPWGNWVNRDLERALKAAGLPDNAFTPHCLRHSAATNLLRCGLPIEVVADQLSHASIETTRRYLNTGGQLAKWRRRHKN